MGAQPVTLRAYAAHEHAEGRAFRAIFVLGRDAARRAHGESLTENGSNLPHNIARRIVDAFKSHEYVALCAGSNVDPYLVPAASRADLPAMIAAIRANGFTRSALLATVDELAERVILGALPDAKPLASFAIEVPHPLPPGAIPLSKVPESAASSIGLRHMAEIVEEQREPEWLLPDILEKRVLAVLAGPRGSFKSFIAQDWGLRAAIAGFGVVILSGEGAGLGRRTEAWLRVHGPDVDPKTLRLVALERPLDLNQTATVKALQAALVGLDWNPDLILIDTLSKYAGGLDENDNAAVALYLSRLSIGLRDAFECSVLLVAHSGHSDPGRPRGASALMANPDAEYIVRRPAPTAMECVVTRERFKDTPSLPPLPYRADLVDLGRTDKRGRPVNSLVMVPTDTPGRPGRQPQGRNQQHVWRTFHEIVGVDEHVEVDALIRGSVDRLARDPAKKHDKRRDRVREAIDALVASGFLIVADDRVTLCRQ